MTGPTTEAGKRLDMAWPAHYDRLEWRELICRVEAEARGPVALTVERLAEAFHRAGHECLSGSRSQCEGYPDDIGMGHHRKQAAPIVAALGGTPVNPQHWLADHEGHTLRVETVITGASEVPPAKPGLWCEKCETVIGGTPVTTAVADADPRHDPDCATWVADTDDGNVCDCRLRVNADPRTSTYPHPRLGVAALREGWVERPPGADDLSAADAAHVLAAAGEMDGWKMTEAGAAGIVAELDGMGYCIVRAAKLRAQPVNADPRVAALEAALREAWQDMHRGADHWNVREDCGLGLCPTIRALLAGQPVPPELRERAG